MVTIHKIWVLEKSKHFEWEGVGNFVCEVNDKNRATNSSRAEEGLSVELGLGKRRKLIQESIIQRNIVSTSLTRTLNIPSCDKKGDTHYNATRKRLQIQPRKERNHTV